MDEELQIIDAYNNLLGKIYDQEKLLCLSDNQFMYDGYNILALSNPAIVQAWEIGLIDRLHEVCEILKIEKSTKTSFYVESELCGTSADIKHRIGTLYLYYPYTVVLSDSYFYHNGKKNFAYNQTRNDARFNKELPVAIEGLYKFWQRLSDYLTSFFPEYLLESKGITYFHFPINFISSQYPQLTGSENFKWIKNFAENVYPTFNKKRKFFVHNSGYDTNYFQKFLNQHDQDEVEILAIDNERKDLLPFLKTQLEYCNEGYIKYMLFLNELDITKTSEREFIYNLKTPS